ncbi:hypothetical protein BH11BAC4_BH11BAC4_22410 [soil metagenome]
MRKFFYMFFNGIKKQDYYRLLLLLLLFTGINVFFIFCRTAVTMKDAKGKSVPVSGVITQTYSYCGGAAAPKQILDQLKTPVPYTGKKFFIRVDNTNTISGKIVKSFTSDSTGGFSFTLEPGIYSIIVEEQLQQIKASDFATEHQQVDENCLSAWWIRPLYILEISDKAITGLNFNFHHPCFISSDIPCLQYSGPPAP